jgi:hypothetical protein
MIIVVGGSGRGAGKTALICGLIGALPERQWTAVKITSHGHGYAEPIYEETVAGQGTDTARYLAAGAGRALMVTADDAALGSLVQGILEDQAQPAHVIFESNAVLHYLRPDLCFGVVASPTAESKPSFSLIEQCMDASVALGGHDHVIPGERIHFHLASLERISPPMKAWLRERLGAKAS